MRHPKAGGAEEYLHRQALYWIEWGHSVSWFSASFSGAPKTEVIDGIAIYRAGGEYSVYAHAPIMYWRYLRDCNVVIDAENGIPFFSPLFSKRPLVLLMFHVHRDILLSELPRPMNYLGWFLEAVLMPLVYRNVQFIAISESTRDDIAKFGYTRKAIAIVHSGVDHALKGDGPKAPVPRAVYVGRVVGYKRLPRLIEQFAHVTNAFPKAELIIAGRGDDMPSCEAVIRRFNLQSSVKLEGWVDESRKRELLSSAWVFVHPSRIEGWGISIIEAAACGTPAIAMRVQGLKDAIVNDETGLLVGDWNAFGEAMHSVFSDQSLRSRLSYGALKYSENFTWRETAAKTIKLLDDVVKRE